MCCLYLGTKQLLSSLPVPYLSQNYPQINHREIKERSCCIPLSLDLLPNMTGGKKKITECPDLEGTHTDHRVQLLALHRTTPKITPKTVEIYYFHTEPFFSSSLHVSYSRLSSFPSAALRPLQWAQIVSYTFHKVNILPQILNCTS